MRHLNRGHQRYLHFCYENLEDPHLNTCSLKFRYENLEDRQKYISFSLFKNYSLLREKKKLYTHVLVTHNSKLLPRNFKYPHYH